MTRGNTDRSERRAPVLAEGFDADTPVAGWYRTKLRSGGVYVGVRVWHGAPLDPVTGEEMDRSHRWQAYVNGSYIDLPRVWPGCADEPISEADYRHYCRLQQWGEQHAPDSALADPTRRIDLLSPQTPLPF